MNKKHMVTVCILALLLSSCAFLPAFTQEEYAHKRRDQMDQQYAPYREQNTVEAYREFIQKYPDNMFVSTARYNLETLEFAPYEKQDSVEGYRGFIKAFPGNSNIVKAATRIDQIEFKRIEEIDTVEAYSEFLQKNPYNIFTLLAQQRLQELEFRAQDKLFQQKYGFDLMLYRLNVGRLQKELEPSGGINPADFTLFASVDEVRGKKYFHTHLIYGPELSRLDATSKEAPELFFKSIISRLLVYLDKKFANKKGVDGFSFDVSFSDHGFHGDKVVLLEYYFPAGSVQLFAQNRIDGSQLLAQAETVVPDKSAQLMARAVPKQAQAPAAHLDGHEIMKIVAQKSSKADDTIIAWNFENISKYGHPMHIKGLSKRKNYRVRDGFVSKVVIYMDMRIYPGLRILQWNGVKKQDTAVWWRWQRGNPSRTTPPEAKNNEFRHLFFEENLIEDETHELLGEEEFEGRQCFVVQSIPRENDQGYAKRITRIWRDTFSPLKIDYYAGPNGNIFKTIHAEMESKYGDWTVKKAVSENFQTGDTSVFTIDDFKWNVGLDDLEFTLGALSRGGG